MHVPLGGEPTQERGESGLGLRGVQCEELLELVHDQQHLVVAPPPARGRLHHALGVAALHELRDAVQQVRDRFRVPRQLPRQPLREGQRGLRPRRADDRPPAGRAPRHHPRPHERGLARSRGSDHGKKAPRDILSHSARTSSSRPKKRSRPSP